MTLKSIAIFMLCAAGFGIFSQPASAQSTIKEVPANFPPASFTGKQYVDNQGCIYVRAGFDGAVTWVPRVTRARKPLCGQTPTFGGATSEAPAGMTPAPVQITVAAPVPEPQAKARTIQPVPYSTAAVSETLRVDTYPPASKPPSGQPPRVLYRVPGSPAAALGTAANIRYDTPCYISSGLGCGTQTTSGVTVISYAATPEVNRASVAPVASRQRLPGYTTIVPRHVYEQRDTQTAFVPKGYRPAWDDDRLNRYRAWQTVDGHRDTQKIWTNTVPRRLVVQVDRHKVKDPLIAYRVTGPTPTARSGSTVQAPWVTSRSAPKAVAGRWVEIGVFTTNAKADAAAARLRAAGLPVSLGTQKRAGKTLRRLSVGPYASSAALQAALGKVHRTGYVQAYIR